MAASSDPSDPTVIECEHPNSPPISIHIPAGMHGIVSIEFQGFLIKTAHLRRIPVGDGIEDEETIMHARNCNSNICNAVLLRGSDASADYLLELHCYNTPCNGNIPDRQETITRFNISGGPDPAIDVCAYTMIYHKGDNPSELGTDYFVVTIVRQLTKSEMC
jgi:hypothetical protein